MHLRSEGDRVCFLLDSSLRLIGEEAIYRKTQEKGKREFCAVPQHSGEGLAPSPPPSNTHTSSPPHTHAQPYLPAAP